MSIPTNQTMQEYANLGIEEDQAYRFWALGVDPYTLSAWMNPSTVGIILDNLSFSPQYNIPLTIKSEIPSPKRRKNRLKI